MRFGQGLGLAAAVALVGGLLPAAQAATGASAAVTFQGTAGHASLVTTTNLSTQKAPLALSPSVSPVVPHAIPLRTPSAKSPAVAGAQAITRAGAAPQVSGSLRAPASLLQSFDGINSTQNLATSTVGLEPPDEGLGVGGGYVINNVNLTFAIYQTNGVLVAGPFSDTTFFHEPIAFTHGSLTSDPRVYYDASTQTWFMTV
ncbi:MAG TPA: hypothetical protein VMW80_10810, partial [Candidatus Dormibacteraeota bacterium]|nr:hypothetical protein [Candidatus Dormibacteraeota bacterium]